MPVWQSLPGFSDTMCSRHLGTVRRPRADRRSRAARRDVTGTGWGRGAIEDFVRQRKMADQPLLATMTGEHFQPVRLHYKVLNRSGLLRAFETLRCLDYDPTRKRWVWLYAHEAKRLRFQRSYAQFPSELHPIVIGAFFLRTRETLLLDLRSCERALLAVPFFDRHLPRRLVELEDAEVVNRLFPATEANQKLTPDALFDSQISTGVDPEALVQRLT